MKIKIIKTSDIENILDRKITPIHSTLKSIDGRLQKISRKRAPGRELFSTLERIKKTERK